MSSEPLDFKSSFSSAKVVNLGLWSVLGFRNREPPPLATLAVRGADTVADAAAAAAAYMVLTGESLYAAP